MTGQTFRTALIAFLAALAALAAWPAVRPLLYSADAPRQVTPRGDLGSAERLTVELFQRLSPSVVHIFATADQGRFRDPEAEDGQGQQTGTGFIWDRPGTSSPTTMSSKTPGHPGAPGRRPHPAGQAGGRAPNVDLAVIRVTGGTTLPPPIPSVRRQICRWANTCSPSATRSGSTRR